MKRKIYIAATALAALSPNLSFAANNSIAKASGISDTTLLVLMLGFIALLLLIINALANSIKGISQSTNQAKKMSQTTKSILAIGVFSTASLGAHAADGTTEASSFVMSNGLFWLLSGLILVLAFVIYVLFKALKTLIQIEKGETVATETKEEGIMEGILIDRVPVEEEESIMLDHEYDGIRELDNNLPPWWVYMFYATIIFAVVYLVRFHITGDGKLSIEEYEDQIAEAAAQKEEQMAEGGEQITEDNVTYLADAMSIEKGAAIFKGNCATCHGQLGEGGAGPNLTDEYWIHGGSISNIFSTIKYGVPEKGMISWQSQFSPEQMQQVSSYIMTLVGTNPPNQKDPQGELYVPVEESAASDSTNVNTEKEVENSSADEIMENTEAEA